MWEIYNGGLEYGANDRMSYSACRAYSEKSILEIPLILDMPGIFKYQLSLFLGLYMRRGMVFVTFHFLNPSQLQLWA